jgi:tripartite-type tricarboxylate transporter receptor subunit TctC
VPKSSQGAGSEYALGGHRRLLFSASFSALQTHIARLGRSRCGGRETCKGGMQVKKGIAIVFAILAASIASGAVQTYPSRPITITIAFPPGGPSEGVTRLLAERLSLSLGQPVVIENRPGGAGGSVGTKAVAGATPDGHTLLLSPPGALVVAPLIYKSIGYDPVKAFTPVATLMSIPQILVVHPAVPVKSMQEFVAYAKANPGKINFPSPGYGTQPHLLGEMFKMMAGVEIVHVPYKGPAQMVTDLLAGQVQMSFENIGYVLPYIESGKLKPLAMAGEVRDPALPGVPTTVESGFPNLQATFWMGIVAPTGVPPTIIRRLNTEINAIMKTKEVAAVLARLSAKPKLGPPEDFAAFMAAETQKWAAVVKAANIRAD